jgi:general secretion pathway protein A
MYDQYYGMHGRPFQLTPDPHFYFESTTHRKALSYLGYGLAQGEGFIVITGDVGAGKTTLVGHLMATIDPSRLTAVKLVSTQVGADDMLRLAAHNFGVASDGVPKAQLLQQIEQFLHSQARKGLRTLLIVDEAQNLPFSAIEELRMLSNFQLGGSALLQIFLLGQPEFRDMMKSPELEQLRQRVIATHHLEPMMESEVEPYIHHRMRLVGWAGNPSFSADAYATIYKATGGVPRRINALMSRVLLSGAIERLTVIDGAVVNTVAVDMGLDSQDIDPEFSLDEEEALLVSVAEPEAPVVEELASEHVMQVVQDTPPADVITEESLIAEDAISDEVAADEVQPDLAEEVQNEAVEPEVAAVSAEELLELRALRKDVDDLRHALALTAKFGDREEELLQRIRDLEARMMKAEAQSVGQEAALRRVLTLLVDWVESEDQAVRAA